MAAIIILILFTPFLAHLFLVRVCGLFNQSFRSQKGVIAGFLLGFIFQGSISLLWQGISWGTTYLFLVYTLAGYVYFHVFNMSETARRIKILSKIGKTGARKEELAGAYTCRDMVLNRLKRLASTGELRFFEGRYVLGRGMLLFPARIVFYFRGMLFAPKA